MLLFFLSRSYKVVCLSLFRSRERERERRERERRERERERDIQTDRGGVTDIETGLFETGREI